MELLQEQLKLRVQIHLLEMLRRGRERDRNDDGNADGNDGNNANAADGDIAEEGGNALNGPN